MKFRRSDLADSVLLTLGSAGCGGGFNGRAIPALDGVQNTLFLLSLGGEASHFSVVDDRLPGTRIDDSGEDGATMAATSS